MMFIHSYFCFYICINSKQHSYRSISLLVLLVLVELTLFNKITFSCFICILRKISLIVSSFILFFMIYIPGTNRKWSSDIKETAWGVLPGGSLRIYSDLLFYYVPYLRLVASSYWWASFPYCSLSLLSVFFLTQFPSICHSSNEEISGKEHILIVSMINTCCIIRYNLATFLVFLLGKICFFRHHQILCLYRHLYISTI